MVLIYVHVACSLTAGKDLADGPAVKGGGLEESRHEGGRLSIDDVEEGHEEGRMVRSFEIRGDQSEGEPRRSKGRDFLVPNFCTWNCSWDSTQGVGFAQGQGIMFDPWRCMVSCAGKACGEALPK
eukprot:163466-Pelagomonas_calceolata.AAC.1